VSRGYTLLEVVVALLLLEVAVLGAAGTLQVAAHALGEAEHMERAVLAAEGVLDSLAGVASPTAGSRSFVGGDLSWTVDSAGTVTLTASRTDGGGWLEVTAAVATP
jgi:Tfp pilus assembly protein PilV